MQIHMIKKEANCLLLVAIYMSFLLLVQSDLKTVRNGQFARGNSQNTECTLSLSALSADRQAAGNWP